MNTNNKEAIQILQTLLSTMNHDELGPAIVIKAVISLLQDNEDTEVQEEPLLQNNPGHEHLPSGLGKGAYCVGCLEELDKPSSKVEKLKELRDVVQKRYGEYSYSLDNTILNLIDILIEDEE